VRAAYLISEKPRHNLVPQARLACIRRCSRQLFPAEGASGRRVFYPCGGGRAARLSRIRIAVYRTEQPELWAYPIIPLISVRTQLEGRHALSYSPHTILTTLPFRRLTTTTTIFEKPISMSSNTVHRIDESKAQESFGPSCIGRVYQYTCKGLNINLGYLQI